jgi:hypothetical protein
MVCDIPGTESVITSYRMKFRVEVGELEKHTIEYHFNQLRGSLLIKVDDKPIVQMKRTFNEPLRETFNFMVGSVERSSVRIEKYRKQLFGHINNVYVDNRLTRVFSTIL